jgi:hypothetical protein
MKRQTITLERYHCYGTPRHHLRLTYRGRTLHWWEQTDTGPASVYADAADLHAPDQIDAMRAMAKRHGFSHLRITGDWSRRDKPRGGLI